MINEEFESLIKVGDVCRVITNSISNSNYTIFNAQYQGTLKEPKLLQFKVINGPWYMQIPLYLIKRVERDTIFFED